MDSGARAGGARRADRGVVSRSARLEELKLVHGRLPPARFTCALILVCLFLFPPETNAACVQVAAEAVSVQGDVEVRRAGDVAWLPLAQGQKLCAGDGVRVNLNARAGILLLKEQTLVRLDQRTTLTLPERAPADPSLLDILKGALHFFSRTPRRMEVITPYVNAFIEGTEFALRVEDDETLLWVYEGRVSAENAQGSLALTSGEAARTRAGQAPRPYVAIDPRDAVEWALYYPPLFDPRALEGVSDRSALRRAIALSRAGQVSQALTVLGNVPDAERDARFFDVEAALLLSIGRVGKARGAIAAARNAGGSTATALAYESVIALTKNRKQEALDLSARAVGLDPDSPTAHTARSYALQSAFDIDGALTSARRAVESAPKDALAWARLAELELAHGYYDAAVDAAKKAASLDPKIARTQSVLGFVDLARIDTEQAGAAFAYAIARDQADPLPRLGLGLAKIREGELEQGRRDIEIAASLDPSQSIVRSYLGKAYFEEKRSPLAAEQYAIAKRLDPQDPTPWFYDAILKQTENRPVEALEDIQKSIKLNNNRAVYRSRLLLDQDVAARSASQARIYRDLGFEQLALVEGWESVNTDPSSYSAHRLLADSYSTLPRHEIARVSELLQSQLLQPLNVTPIQPQLTEADPLILEGAGPSALAFNEFNPLFLRNGTRFLIDGVVGGNDTYGEDVVVSGIHDWLSYSLGQFHFESDGFRENNDQEIDLYNAFVQASLSPSTSVQAEIQSQDSEAGNLSTSLLADFDFPSFRGEEETDTLRLGLHHAFSPGKDLLVSLIGNRREIPGGSDEGYNAEVQQQLNYRSIGLIGGTGYASSVAETLGVDTADSRHLNSYLYSHLDVSARAVLDLGLSVDDFFSDQGIGLQEELQVNPKLGLIWNPVPSTTLRAAAFRVLKRSLVNNQTLEPTQLAGFNQFFDDINGTDSTRWGVALDQRLTDALYGGLEYSQRDLDVPILVQLSPSVPSEFIKFNWEEHVARAYLFYAPHPRWALRMEPTYEFFDRGEDPISIGTGRFSNLRTLRTPLGASYFHPSGLSAGFNATYYDQEGLVVNSQFLPEAGHENFWIMDAQLSYRLPKRRGIVSLSLNNLLDEDSPYQEVTSTIDPTSAVRTFFPERTLLLQATLSF